MANTVLHVYGQGCWHDDVYILGDPETMRALADAILRALNGKPWTARKVHAYTSDGEGYDVFVAYADETIPLEKLAVPYTDPDARERRKDALRVVAYVPRDGRVVSLRRWKAGRR